MEEEIDDDRKIEIKEFAVWHPKISRSVQISKLRSLEWQYSNSVSLLSVEKEETWKTEKVS